MNLADLLRKDIIRKIEPDKVRAKELLALAERDLKVASDNLSAKNYDWALAIAYNAMLNSGMALMISKGYRAASESHHIAVVQFCAVMLPSDSLDLANMFNKYRVRRHDVVYGQAKSVGEDEAKKAIDNAKKYLEKIKEKMT